MANLKLHTIGIHGGFHLNFLYTVVRTVTVRKAAYMYLSGHADTHPHLCFWKRGGILVTSFVG